MVIVFWGASCVYCWHFLQQSFCSSTTWIQETNWYHISLWCKLWDPTLQSHITSAWKIMEYGSLWLAPQVLLGFFSGMTPICSSLLQWRSFTVSCFRNFFYGKISCVSFSLLSLWTPTPCAFFNFHMQFVNSTCNTKAYAVFGISNSSSISQSITFLMNPNAANVIYLLIVRHFSSCLWTQCGMISNSKKFRSSILDGEIYVEITSLQASRNKTMMSFARKETLFTLE